MDVLLDQDVLKLSGLHFVVHDICFYCDPPRFTLIFPLPCNTVSMHSSQGGCLWSQLLHSSPALGHARPEMKIDMPGLARPPRKKALLIGIRSSDDLDSSLQELRGPHRDVQDMKMLLRELSF
jgi:hypothetical protein